MSSLPAGGHNYASAIDTALGLVAVVALIAANGFFVAAEFALVAVDRTALARRAASGDRLALRVEGLVRNLSFHLSGAQLGITVTSLVVGFLAGPLLGRLLGPLIEPIVGAGAAEGVAVVLALVLATFVQMVFGELAPKSVAIARPDRTARRLAPAVSLYGVVFGPVIRFLDGAANRTVRLVGMEPASELSPARTLAEFDVLFRTAVEQGELGPSAADLLEKSVRLSRRTAAEVLVPRTPVDGLPTEASVADLVALSRRSGHSRFVVFGTDLDDPRGVVHVKAAYGIERRVWSSVTVAEVMEELLAVPESRDLDDLLVDLRATGHDLVVVLDEHGGTAGIVTLEDVLEQVVGAITDEHDRWQAGLTRSVAPGEWVLDGAAHPDLVTGETGLVLPDGPYETLAGFLLQRLGRIPDVGDEVVERGWRLRVEAMDRRRIASVRVVAP